MASIATVVICAGFLFFYREGNIFGIQYINRKETIIAKSSDDMGDVGGIEVNASGFDVRIEVNQNVDEIMGAMKNNVFGYVKKSKAQAKFTLDYNPTTKTAVFNAVEPKGWINKSKSYVLVVVPGAWAEKGCDVKINTKKGDISIGGNNEWMVKDVAINSTKGDTLLKNLTILNRINVDIGSGKIVIDKDCETVGDIKANLSVGSGKIGFADINVDKFKFGMVNVQKLKKGKISIIKATELVSPGNIKGGGKIEIGEVASVNFESLDTSVYINEIVSTGKNGEIAKIIINGQGKVIVNQARCCCAQSEKGHFDHFELVVDGHNGDIQVGKVGGSMSLFANQGDIRVTEAFGLVSAESTYGKIDIKFGNAFDYDSVRQNRAVIATTKNGSINIVGLQKGNITATGKGRINLEYNKVAKDNVVISNSGAINIVVPSGDAGSKYAFNLSVSSEVKKDIKVGVGGKIGVEYVGSGTEIFENIYNSQASTENNLNIQSKTGLIKIRSADLVKY